MKVIDLSHTIAGDMPVFPGTPQPVLKPLLSIEEHGFGETMLQMMSHTGTHMDAPSHMIAGAPGLDDFLAEKFFGPALIINHLPSAGRSIELEALRQEEDKIARAEFVLFCTGHSEKWGSAEYLGPFPLLTRAAAEFLTSFPLKGVGIDAISFDELDATDSPIHRILLSAGFVLLENLANLRQAPAEGGLFAALPLKYKNADGSPVRAVLIGV